MKTRNIATICAVAVIVIVALAASYFVLMDDDKPTKDDRAAVAAEMLEDGNFQNFYERCDPTLQATLGGTEGLAAMWMQYTYGIGDFVGIEDTEEISSGTNTVTQTQCRHSDWGLLLTITFAEDDGIVGLFFGFYEPEGVDPLPDGLIETDATVDAGTGYPLPGTITSSIDSGHDVAAVIVHGSGPNDRDGTLVVNKPYRDIARGLAAQGIDVLTYDKRTYIYGAGFCDDPMYATVDDETVDDAVAAIAMLKGMGYEKVYLIGHSMGGMLAPYIVERCSGLCDGFISLAGSPRDLTDILADQLWAQYSQLPDADVYRQYIDSQLAVADTLADMTDEQRASVTVFDQSGYYIWSLDSIDEISIAKSLEVPMLFLQGGADFQVYADVDFALWEEALADDPDATFVLYEDLGHPFIASERPFAGTALEYYQRGHVDPQVIGDIAAFILDECPLHHTVPLRRGWGGAKTPLSYTTPAFLYHSDSYFDHTSSQIRSQSRCQNDICWSKSTYHG